MPMCAIYNCTSDYKPDRSVRLFSLPTVIKHLCDRTKELSTKRRAVWLSRINRNFGNRELNGSLIKVCHKHFLKGKPSALFDETNPDWAPSLNLGYGKSEMSTEYAIKSANRYARAKARHSKLNSRNDVLPSASRRVNLQVEFIENTTPQSFADGFQQVGRENPLVDIVASEEPPESPEPPLTDVSQPSGRDIMLVVDIKNTTPQSFADVFQQMEGVGPRSLDFGCQADIHVQQPSEYCTKCNELFTQNCRLMERMSLMESQLATLALEKGKLQYERDSLNLDNIHMRREVSQLKTQLRAATINEKDFEDDNDKTKFYTGLPDFYILKVVYDLTENQVPHSNRNAMPKFTEFLMTMMRLRLGLLEQDLAYRFHVSQSTVSSVCCKWITVMTATLSKFIVWPERTILRRTMPSRFTDVFGDKVAVIVDCFELFTGNPSLLGPRAETGSQYKRHNTVKFLIGITPQGTVSFVSNGYGGRASDEFITLNSGILEKLVPGDVILANKGFDIADDVGMRQASLAIPAFTIGKEQLSFDNVHKTRGIANVRIHVERLIGCLKRKFRILSGDTINYSYLCPSSETGRPPIDDIVKICCALTNLCSPLTPDENQPATLDQNSVINLLFENISRSSD